MISAAEKNKIFEKIKKSENLHTRRDFIVSAAKGLTVLVSSTAIANFLNACSSDSSPTSPSGENNPPQDVTIQIDTTESRFTPLQNVGGTVALNPGDFQGLPSNGVFIIRTSQSVVTALSRTCTHQGCQVAAFSNDGLAHCPCHGSVYDKSGNVVSGPAPRSLQSYSATINGNTIEFTV
jgi:Rieske Fe-S protein